MFEFLLILCKLLLSGLLDEIRPHKPFLLQLVGIFDCVRLVNLSYRMVHLWLGKLRLIQLIVPKLSVTDNIEHYILFVGGLITDC